mmetsp:Transcript_28204/g.41630  ORF Transcript_28204/g.41630 Transcript_28204/m.41630 type:complete len:196 (+) Transcript_28204:3-590(+)
MVQHTASSLPPKTCSKKMTIHHMNCTIRNISRHILYRQHHPPLSTTLYQQQPTSFFSTTTSLSLSSSNKKTALVLGVANNRSLAWSCALSLLSKNYHVVVTYQNDRFASRVQDLITHYNNNHTTPEEKKGKAYSYECDISSDASVQNLCQSLPSLLSSGGGNEKKIEIQIKCIGPQRRACTHIGHEGFVFRHDVG